MFDILGHGGVGQNRVHVIFSQNELWSFYLRLIWRLICLVCKPWPEKEHFSITHLKLRPDKQRSGGS